MEIVELQGNVIGNCELLSFDERTVGNMLWILIDKQIAEHFGIQDGGETNIVHSAGFQL